MAFRKVRRSVITSCLTCPICCCLLERPTSVSACNHVFCRKCIYGKIVDEGGDCCPLCNIKLGRVPSEKLREDHTLQSVIIKILQNMRNTESLEPSVTVPAKLKEKSLSSLNGRTKTLARKAALPQCIESREDTLLDFPDSSDIFEAKNRFSHSESQTFPNTVPSNHLMSRKCSDEVDSPLAGKAHKSKLLNDQNETANGSQLADANNSEAQMSSVGHKLKSSIQDDGYSTDQVSSQFGNKMKVNKRGRKRGVTFQDQGVTDQDAVDAKNFKWKINTGPIWFTLVASEKQGGYVPLPQISPSYLRIKESSMPILFIQKYIMEKLSLQSETEVEIMCLGQLISPTMQLDDLFHWWLKKTLPSEEMQKPTESHCPIVADGMLNEKGTKNGIKDTFQRN